MSEATNRIVVADASVLVDALTSIGDVANRAREALRGRRLMAPEHLRIETFHVIRSRLLSHKLSSETAKEAVRDLANLPLDVLPSAILLRRMWELRNDLSGYDAVYVAAAEHLGAPLVTFDKRLAGAPGLRCEVRIP